MASSPKDHLWHTYSRQRDPSTREKLILAFLPLVKQVAGRLAIGLPKHVETDDLLSYGVFGLIDAIEKFDPNRGVKFETYAVARIRGAILDGLRALDWVPASVRQKRREVEAAYQRLEGRLHRTATDEEVANELNVSLKDFGNILLNISGAALLSLEETWFGHHDDMRVKGTEIIPDVGSEDPVKELQSKETQRLLTEAIERLPRRESLVITLYYYEGLTIREIGEILGVTPSRVSQLHTKSILRLRGRLGRLRTDLLDEQVR